MNQFPAKGSEDISSGPGNPPRDQHADQPMGTPYNVNSDTNEQQQGQGYGG